MQVIPTINADSFEEIQERIKLIESYTDPAKGGINWVQIDAADGTFTKNTIWHNAGDLLSIETPLNIEVHLMIDKIEDRVEDWFLAPVKRIIFHLEAAKDPHFVVKKCKEAGKEVGVAIGPDTPWTRLVPFYGRVDLFQILAVYPGLAGQKFIEESLEKISDLRKNCPDAIIEVDGGINKETAKKCKEAGADIVSAASYIFNSKNIEQSINNLKCL
ncbi:ribulose-phosphate 3-epimerase [Patescibacteria group bacterium]|nr:ribulose-phosphate 3-epimerase [Patescibacteria group bacterium]